MSAARSVTRYRPAGRTPTAAGSAGSANPGNVQVAALCAASHVTDMSDGSIVLPASAVRTRSAAVRVAETSPLNRARTDRGERPRSERTLSFLTVGGSG